MEFAPRGDIQGYITTLRSDATLLRSVALNLNLREERAYVSELAFDNEQLASELERSMAAGGASSR